MLLKRTAFAVIGLLAFIGQALGAGSISLSGSQQLDSQARPLSGGLLYFFQSGTTTPQSAFQDTALTIPFSNPIVLDASGRVPFFYLADGNIKIRLSDSTGVTVVAADSILVIGPSAGGGGGGSVDPTTVYQTGDIKQRYGTGTHNGWVRANGRTIGSATSGGTERANSDCQVLFEYLWVTDVNLAVSGGRGGSANADWIANKTIALPDYRGRVFAGMDDMGNAAANRITVGGSGITGTTLGSSGGLQISQLITANLPSHTHSLSVSGTTSSDGSHTHTVDITDPGHFHSIPSSVAVASGAGEGVTNDTGSAQSTGSKVTGITASTVANGAHTHTVTSTGTSGAAGSGTTFQTISPLVVAHIYIKL